jgi:hypothetical protein
VAEDPGIAIGDQPLVGEQGREADRERDDAAGQEQGPAAVGGDEPDQVILGDDQQEPPVLGRGLGERRRRHDMALPVDLDDGAPGAGDAHAIVRLGEDRVAEHRHLRGTVVAVAAIHDPGGVRVGDQPAGAVHDQGAAIGAEREVRKEAAELGQRDVGTGDPEQLAAVAADRVRHGEARLLRGEEHIDVSPEQTVGRARAPIPGADAGIEGVGRVLLDRDDLPGLVPAVPGALAAPVLVRDQLGVERPLRRALHHEEVAFGIADVERRHLRAIPEQLLRQPVQELPARGGEAALGAHAGQRAHRESRRVEVALDLGLDSLIEGGNQVLRENERIVPIGAVGVERDRDDRGDDQGDAGERHAEARQSPPARAPHRGGIGIDVDDLVGAHLANLGRLPSFPAPACRRAGLPASLARGGRQERGNRRGRSQGVVAGSALNASDRT